MCVYISIFFIRYKFGASVSLNVTLLSLKLKLTSDFFIITPVTNKHYHPQYCIWASCCISWSLYIYIYFFIATPVTNKYYHPKYCISASCCFSWSLYIYIHTHTYAIQSSMQLHRLLIESPCLHVNSWHVSAIQGHHQVYMIYIQYYTVL
jgi:hypothetical protein